MASSVQWTEVVLIENCNRVSGITERRPSRSTLVQLSLQLRHRDRNYTPSRHSDLNTQCHQVDSSETQLAGRECISVFGTDRKSRWPRHCASDRPALCCPGSSHLKQTPGPQVSKLSALTLNLGNCFLDLDTLPVIMVIPP